MFLIVFICLLIIFISTAFKFKFAILKKKIIIMTLKRDFPRWDLAILIRVCLIEENITVRIKC